MVQQNSWGGRGAVKVYIVADLEGVSGVGGYDIRREEIAGIAARREKWLKLWVGELNAAIEGAKKAGAEQIYVLDNHGPGDNIPLARLATPAQLIHGKGRPTWLPLLENTVDGLVFIGQHARAGSGGHLCHTYSRNRLRRVSFDGREIGEIGLVASIGGTKGIPAVFLSGDDRAVAEAREWIPGIECVTTKESLSVHACVSLSVRAVRERIREGVFSGLSRRREIAPIASNDLSELLVEYRARDMWRVPARHLLRWGQGGRMTWQGGLRFTGASLPELWDRFLGLSQGME
jgi:D-amino peptidase